MSKPSPSSASQDVRIVWVAQNAEWQTNQELHLLDRATGLNYVKLHGAGARWEWRIHRSVAALNSVDKRLARGETAPAGYAKYAAADNSNGITQTLESPTINVNRPMASAGAAYFLYVHTVTVAAATGTAKPPTPQLVLVSVIRLRVANQRAIFMNPPPIVAIALPLLWFELDSLMSLAELRRRAATALDAVRQQVAQGGALQGAHRRMPTLLRDYFALRRADDGTLHWLATPQKSLQADGLPQVPEARAYLDNIQRAHTLLTVMAELGVDTLRRRTLAAGRAPTLRTGTVNYFFYTDGTDTLHAEWAVCGAPVQVGSSVEPIHLDVNTDGAKALHTTVLPLGERPLEFAQHYHSVHKDEHRTLYLHPLTSLPDGAGSDALRRDVEHEYNMNFVADSAAIADQSDKARGRPLSIGPEVVRMLFGPQPRIGQSATLAFLAVDKVGTATAAQIDMLVKALPAVAKLPHIGAPQRTGQHHHEFEGALLWPPPPTWVPIGNMLPDSAATPPQRRAPKPAELLEARHFAYLHVVWLKVMDDDARISDLQAERDDGDDDASQYTLDSAAMAEIRGRCAQALLGPHAELVPYDFQQLAHLITLASMARNNARRALQQYNIKPEQVSDGSWHPAAEVFVRVLEMQRPGGADFETHWIPADGDAVALSADRTMVWPVFADTLEGVVLLDMPPLRLLSEGARWLRRVATRQWTPYGVLQEASNAWLTRLWQSERAKRLLHTTAAPNTPQWLLEHGHAISVADVPGTLVLAPKYGRGNDARMIDVITNATVNPGDSEAALELYRSLQQYVARSRIMEHDTHILIDHYWGRAAIHRQLYAQRRFDLPVPPTAVQLALDVNRFQLLYTDQQLKAFADAVLSKEDAAQRHLMAYDDGETTPVDARLAQVRVLIRSVDNHMQFVHALLKADTDWLRFDGDGALQRLSDQLEELINKILTSATNVIIIYKEDFLYKLLRYDVWISDTLRALSTARSPSQYLVRRVVTELVPQSKQLFAGLDAAFARAQAEIAKASAAAMAPLAAAAAAARTDPTRSVLAADVGALMNDVEARIHRHALPRLTVMHAAGVQLPYTAAASLINQHAMKPLAHRIDTALARVRVAQHQMPALERPQPIGAQMDDGPTDVLHRFAGGLGLAQLATQQRPLRLSEVHAAALDKFQMANLDAATTANALVRWALLAWAVYLDVSVTSMQARTLGTLVERHPTLRAEQIAFNTNTAEYKVLRAVATRFLDNDTLQRQMWHNYLRLAALHYVAADALWQVDETKARALLGELKPPAATDAMLDRVLAAVRKGTQSPAQVPDYVGLPVGVDDMLRPGDAGAGANATHVEMRDAIKAAKDALQREPTNLAAALQLLDGGMRRAVTIEVRLAMSDYTARIMKLLVAVAQARLPAIGVLSTRVPDPLSERAAMLQHAFFRPDPHDAGLLGAAVSTFFCCELDPARKVTSLAELVWADRIKELEREAAAEPVSTLGDSGTVTPSVAKTDAVAGVAKQRSDAADDTDAPPTAAAGYTPQQKLERVRGRWTGEELARAAVMNELHEMAEMAPSSIASLPLGVVGALLWRLLRAPVFVRWLHEHNIAELDAERDRPFHYVVSYAHRTPDGSDERVGDRFVRMTEELARSLVNTLLQEEPTATAKLSDLAARRYHTAPNHAHEVWRLAVFGYVNEPAAYMVQPTDAEPDESALDTRAVQLQIRALIELDALLDTAAAALSKAEQALVAGMERQALLGAVMSFVLTALRPLESRYAFVVQLHPDGHVVYDQFSAGVVTYIAKEVYAWPPWTGGATDTRGVGQAARALLQPLDEEVLLHLYELVSGGDDRWYTDVAHRIDKSTAPLLPPVDLAGWTSAIRSALPKTLLSQLYELLAEHAAAPPERLMVRYPRSKLPYDGTDLVAGRPVVAVREPQFAPVPTGGYGTTWRTWLDVGPLAGLETQERPDSVEGVDGAFTPARANFEVDPRYGYYESRVGRQYHLRPSRAARNALDSTNTALRSWPQPVAMFSDLLNGVASSRNQLRLPELLTPPNSPLFYLVGWLVQQPVPSAELLKRMLDDADNVLAKPGASPSLLRPPSAGAGTNLAVGRREQWRAKQQEWEERLAKMQQQFQTLYRMATEALHVPPLVDKRTAEAVRQLRAYLDALPYVLDDAKYAELEQRAGLRDTAPMDVGGGGGAGAVATTSAAATVPTTATTLTSAAAPVAATATSGTAVPDADALAKLEMARRLRKASGSYREADVAAFEHRIVDAKAGLRRYEEYTHTLVDQVAPRHEAELADAAGRLYRPSQQPETQLPAWLVMPKLEIA